MTTISGTYCPHIKCLKIVLNKWISLNKRIFTAWRPEGDVPWWYNERASLSTLSGAVWLSGGIAFEEYCDSKRYISSRSKRLSKSYAGRVDFYYEINGHEFKGETKFCWFRVPNQIGSVNKHLNMAKQDIRKSHPDGQRRLAIVFVIPSVLKKHKHKLKDKINDIMEKIKELDGDAFGWVFPDIENSIVYNKKRIYPGAIIIIKEVKR